MTARKVNRSGRGRQLPAQHRTRKQRQRDRRRRQQERDNG